MGGGDFALSLRRIGLKHICNSTFNLTIDFVPTVIPLLQARNLVVGPRTSKSVQQNVNNPNLSNLFVNQVFNHQQVSSNNVPSILSNSNNHFNSQPFLATDRASSINHHVALNAQVNKTF